MLCILPNVPSSVFAKYLCLLCYYSNFMELLSSWNMEFVANINLSSGYSNSHFSLEQTLSIGTINTNHNNNYVGYLCIKNLVLFLRVIKCLHYIMLKENEKIIIPFKALPIHLWRENLKLLILFRKSE